MVQFAVDNNNRKLLSSSSTTNSSSPLKTSSQVIAKLTAEVRATRNGFLTYALFGFLIVAVTLTSTLSSRSSSTSAAVTNLLLASTIDSTTTGTTTTTTTTTNNNNNNRVAQQASIEPFDVYTNAQEMKKWRQYVREACWDAKTKEDVLAIDVLNSKGFKFIDTDKVPAQPRDDTAVKRCSRVVMDFGANIGDTSGHVIDSGMINCEKKDISPDAVTPTTHFDVIDTKRFQYIDKRNKLTHNIAGLMDTQNPEGTKEIDKLGPEDYCYYGVEGNPVFTERLRSIEDNVMSIRPRPVQHMHFFTESVGAGNDGPTKLYLDTVNTEQNFWGSSIFEGHQDVRKSIDQNNGNITQIAANVMGYTIGTMMKNTLSAFDPNNDNNGNSNTNKNHLILKVDIEGGEYPLLSEAVEEGTLCRFVKEMGHTADVYIEFHSQRVTGKHDYAGKTKYIKETLTECGVTFRNLQAWWA